MGSSICPIARREVITIGRNESSTNSTAGKRTYTVVEVMEILGVSRKKAYELCNSGCFKIVRIGRSIRVSKSSFDEWLDTQS
ncbi:MAG: helix-turn-helix domain-containing protein [Clostridium sp.]|nr:helix-turn-helix domain-containing protein [Clostridium sp.]